jgi:serine/threonine-protein kinase
MGTMKRRFMWAVFAVSIAAAAPARAQEDPMKSAAAQRLFDEAKAHATQGNWAEACPKLAQSNQLEPRPTTLFHLGECYEHVGKLASAWSAYLGAASGATAAGQTKRADFARDRAKKIENAVPFIVVTVHQPNAVVLRDGERLEEAKWGSKLPVDPGEHVVAADAPGRQGFTARVVVQPGSTTVITVPPLPPVGISTAPIDGSPPPLAAPPPPSETPKASESRGNPALRRLGIALAGVGVASLGVGTGLVISGKDSEGHCTGSCGVGSGLLVGGGIFAAAGLVFFLASFNDDAARSSSTKARPFVLQF